MEDYDKFIRRVRGQRVEEDHTEELKRRILEATTVKKKESYINLLIGYLFGWTEIPWLRTSMVVTSLAFVILIFIQQGIMVDRIGSIENRIISTNTENILRFQKEMMHANSTLVTMSSDQLIAKDSVKVAGEDLLGLLKSYRELQARYDELLEIVNQSISGDQVKKVPDREKLKL